MNDEPTDAEIEDVLVQDVLMTLNVASEYWEEFTYSYPDDLTSIGKNQIIAALHVYDGDEGVRKLDKKYKVTVTVEELK